MKKAYMFPVYWFVFITALALLLCSGCGTVHCDAYGNNIKEKVQDDLANVEYKQEKD